MFIFPLVVDAGVYKVYNNGDEISYSPEGVNTYKWIVINDGGKNSDTVTLFMNENIFGSDGELYAPQASWNTSGNTQNPPTTLLEMLNLYTGINNATVPKWEKVEKISGKYDNITYNNVYARLITAKEIAALSKFNFVNDNITDVSQIVSYSPIASYIDATGGFWTSTGVGFGTESAWIVTANGKLAPFDAANSEGTYYIRPVVNVKKTNINPNNYICVNEIVLDDKIDVEYGSKIKLSPTTKPEGVPTTIKYSTDDSSIITITNDGTITPLKVGSAKVFIGAECVVKYITVNVSHKKLEDENISININSKYDLTDAKFKNMKWESSDSKIANVENNQIVATKVGNVVLTGTNDTSKIKINVNVLSAPKYILGNLVSITEDEEYDFVKNNNVLKEQKLSWSTSDNKIATIDANGKLKAIKDGQVKITAKNDELLFENFVVIKSKSTSNISSTLGEELNIGNGSKIELPNKPSGDDLKWNSSNENIVKVDEKGNITTVGPGTAIITAKNDKSEFITQVNVYEKLENKDNKKVGILKNDNLIAKNTVLDVKEIKDSDKEYKQVSEKKLGLSKYKVYDITLLLDGVKVQPNGDVIIEFEIPEGYNPNKIVVYRVENDNTYTKLDSKIVNGKIQAKTEHFSYYIVAEENASSSESAINNPQTGTIISISILIIGSLVAGGIYYYTRNKRKFIRL